ncbi:response regulator [Stutzerimonas tarimensis]|uniref:Response regulator n=1 Tax=Stutzerimonas tarimensis TaxID=1507735 RepID=A0ABV7T1Z7_9GAMM
MTEFTLLICDDSSMARKQLLRALPSGWPAQVFHAADGQVGLELLRQKSIDLVLLDLTMPVLDGYGMLAAIRREGLSCQVVVVSGDIQDEAVRRVTELGALAFLQKPVDPAILMRTLVDVGLYDPAARSGLAQGAEEPQPSFRDSFQEVVNVAMGQAAALLAKVLGVYVRLPVPNVNLMEVGELQMALAQAGNEKRLVTVSQGYIAGGISGEALLIFHDSEIADVARLMHWQPDQSSPMELLLDLSCVLIGACLRGIAAQLNLPFSQGHPQILSHDGELAQCAQLEGVRWQRTLAVELCYGIEGYDIHFDLLLLFSEDSVPLIQRNIAYLME